MDNLNIESFTKKDLRKLIKSPATLETINLELQTQNILLQKGFDRLVCLSEINIEPRPWQIETALKVLKDMQGSGILADEVGLGKTIEAGLIIKELLHRNLIQNALVLVPAPLVEQWKNEMVEKFNISFFDVREEGWEEKELLISSMPLATRSKERREALQKRTYDLVVVDEAHSLKNHQTSTYKFVYSLNRKHTILMSATPIQNDLRELFNLVNILKPGMLQSRRKFRREFMEERFKPKNIEKLKQLLKEVMIRHRRTDTLVELPRRKVMNNIIEINGLERDFYNGVVDFCRDIYRNQVKSRMSVGTEESRVELIVLLLMSLLKQNSSSPQSTLKTLETKVLTKLEKEEEIEACEKLIKIGKKIKVPTKAKTLIDKIKDSEEQCIVYSEYIPTLSMLKKAFEKEDIEVILYHGGMNPKEKAEAVTLFKEGKGRVFLSTESGGQGLNLQFCHILYNYDLPWNPMKIEQRIGRVHRFGQKNDVEIYMMPIKGTIDEYLLYILTSKVNLFEMVIGELDTIMSYMLQDDVSLEVKIGEIILTSKSSKEIEEKMRQISQEVIKAKEEYDSDVIGSSAVLDEIGVSEHE